MELRIYWRGRDRRSLRGFRLLESHLGARAERVVFATNAGMFDADGDPIGLYVEQGVEGHRLNTAARGPGNFHMMPNGVFFVDREGAHVMTTAAYREADRLPHLATQSGPMLVIDGALHPAFQPDGASRNVRNGVGVNEAGHAVFAISDTFVSFGKFARLFRDALGCANALYFDGSVSSLWAPSLGRRDDGAPLGPMIVALRR